MILRLAIFSVLFSLPLTAEPEKKKEPEFPRHLRFLPLGEAPPFEQEIRDGVRYEIEPPAGSLPPREITPVIGKTNLAPLFLSLGRINGPVGIPNGIVPIELRSSREGSNNWMTLTPPETGSLLVLSWRNAGDRWDKPRHLILPDGPEFKAGTLRLTNLCPVEIRLILGEIKLALPPGKIHGQTVPFEQDFPIQLAWVSPDGQTHPFYSGAYLLNPGERGELILYRADGEQPRQPVKVLNLREKAPEPPKVP